MAHWKKFMDKELLGAHDLDGRDITVTIVEVNGAELTNGTKKNKKPVATLASGSGRKLDKKLPLNSTNCKVIEQLSGSPDVDKWKGLRITLYPTTTQMGGETKDCIRIRPHHPKNGKGKPEASLSEQIADEMARDQGAGASANTIPRDTDGDDTDVPADEASDA